MLSPLSNLPDLLVTFASQTSYFAPSSSERAAGFLTTAKKTSRTQMVTVFQS